MPVPSNRNTVIGHRFIALFDQIRFDVWVLGASYLVPLAGNETAVETHRRRTGDYLAAVVGVITDADEIHHG